MILLRLSWTSGLNGNSVLGLIAQNYTDKNCTIRKGFDVFEDNSFKFSDDNRFVDAFFVGAQRNY